MLVRNASLVRAGGNRVGKDEPGRGGREGSLGKSGAGREEPRAEMSMGGGELIGGRTGWEETMFVGGHQHQDRQGEWARMRQRTAETEAGHSTQRLDN